MTELFNNYVTEADLVAALGITPRAFRNWKARGEVPPRVQIGRRSLYRKETIEAWLLSRESRKANDDN